MIRSLRSLSGLHAGLVIAVAMTPAFMFAISVSPDGVNVSYQANTNQSAGFSVNGLVSGQSYSRTITCTGQVTSCTSTTPSTFTAASSSMNITVTYTTTSAGTATVALTVSGNGSSDGGSYNVTVVPSYGVAVTPDGGTAPGRTANTGGYSETFTVKNTGWNQNTYSFTCTGAGGVTCGTVPSPVTIVGGGANQTTVSMPYSVGAPGTGTLTLTATGTSASDAGSYTVPILTSGVSVTPDGSVTPTRFSSTTGYSETFAVKNTGTVSNTYSFTCSGGGGIACGTVPSAVTLSAGAQTNVSMLYNTGAPGTGTLTLTATGTGASDAGSFTIPVALTLSKVSNGSLSLDLLYLLQQTANTYDASGRITQLTDARGVVTNYLYDGNLCTAQLSKVTRVHNSTGTIDLVTDINCNSSGFVSSIKDEAGTFRYFTYDAYGRLLQIKNNAQSAVKGYGYLYSRTSANSWTFQPASPNAVADSTFVQQTPSVKVVVGTGYIDGLGRSIQTVVQDGANYHVSGTQYDLMGRTWRVWKPYTRTTAGYDASFTTNATNWYNTYHATSTAHPYTETQFTTDELSRVKQQTPEYVTASPTAFVTHAFGVSTANVQTYTEVTDESGKKVRNYFDRFGNTVTTILGYGATEATTTQFTYNVLGQRTQVTDPRGLVTTYTLDTRGLLSARTSPDAGTVSFKYDKGGNLRFSQDANQAALGQVYFSSYDFAGRALISGLGVATFASLNPDATEALETTQGNWLVVRAYDAKPSTAGFPWSLFSTQISPLTLSNVAGRLAAVASKSNGAWQVTLFSYDADGQIANRYIYTQANGGASVLTALNTTVSYARDLRGSLTQRTETVGTSTFYLWYDYDNRGLLTKTYASTTSTKPASADVTDTYLPTGQPQDYQFQGGPLVPIRYTIRGQTQKIADPTLGTCPTCPFAARYVYLPNGVVDTAEFYNAGSPAAQKRYRYSFGAGAYDALNRLKSADFSSWSGTAWTTTLAYDLAGITYDAAGNIKTLQRYRDAATLIDNITYTYPSSSNRLSSVTDAVATTAESWDAETGSFTYDANGNVITAPAPYSITAVTYDAANLPISLTRSGTTTTYRYDETGQRITKQVGTGNTEVYLREGATTLGVFTVNGSGSAVSWYFNLLWENRVVGRQPNTGNRSYYHFDILGSARAVTQGATVVESHDYDPWGLEMPARGLGSGTKEAFSGKEQDTETGLDYFGARYYMPALGRWAAVDPVADGMPQWSVYNYVYDNPVTQTDPFGLQPEPHTELLPNGQLVRTSGSGDVVEGLVKGLVDVAKGAWSAITHPADFIDGLYQTAEQGVDFNEIVQENVDLFNSGPEGLGEVIGRGVGIFALGRALTPRTGPVITERYRRPSNATTPAQRANVQGRPCARCGRPGGRMFAGHKRDLVREWYQTGKIDKAKMRSLDAVQPECSTCSARGGAEAAQYSKKQAEELKLPPR